MNSRDIYVVIPSYNERHVLAQTIAEVQPYGYTIVVVDDGSAVPEKDYLPDSFSSQVWYLRHLTNLGAGAAVQTGTEFALEKGARIIVHFDADGQHSPSQIERLVHPIRQEQYDVVMGSRFIEPGDRALVPLKKRIVLRAGIFVSWAFTGMWLTDTHNGFRALSREAAKHIKLRENGYAHCTEILEQIRKSGVRYTEVPTTVQYSTHSVAKGQSVFNSFNILIDLMIQKILR